VHITHFVANGVLQTAYNECATGSSHAPVIFVHGFTGSKLDFQDQLAWFSDDRRVIAFDQRGHGETSNATPYDFYTMANDLFGLMDAIDIERAHILGHSMGGMVVLRAVIAQPERFASMILMDTSPGPVQLFDEKTRAALNEVVLEHGCAALFEGMQANRQPRSVKRGIAFLGEEEHWRRIRVKLEQMDPEAWVALTALLGDHPSVLSSLARLEVPTTIMVGAKDKPFLAASKQMAETLPNAELVRIPRAGHSPQYENADLWRSAIQSHLAKHD